jgi:CRP-like cAMP-binding protein
LKHRLQPVAQFYAICLSAANLAELAWQLRQTCAIAICYNRILPYRIPVLAPHLTIMVRQTADLARPDALDKRALLRSHPLFKDLDEAIIDRIVSHALTRKVKKGAVLFRKGDAGTNLYAVCAGAIRISAPSELGKDAIFNLITPGEVFGEIALLDGGERTADAVAIEDCDLMVIERRDFAPLLREFPDIAMRLIEVLCSRLRHTTEQVEDVMFLGLPGRLAKVLLYLHQRSPAEPPRRTIRVTQREISQMIGVSRESANKQLRDWEKRKWLKLERGGVVILMPRALEGEISEEAVI